jgi:single-stranded-DNA-specific exonuclease
MKSRIHREREWKILPSPEGALVEEIVTALACARPFAALLARRGGENWRRLIDPDLTHLHSPFALKGMAEGVSRLVRAIENNDPIFIHGDFDVDGLSGAAVLYQGLFPLVQKGTIKVDVGDRARGHGLSREFLHRTIDEKFSLVITADCGITNVDEVAALREAGIDTIITDHHLPSPLLPQAIAIIDPHQPGETYPNPNLAGVGVAFKLICGLYERLERPHPYPLLDLVALGTIADLVPLSENGEVENQAMVREGFSIINRGEGSSLGLRVLLQKLSVDPRTITASDIGYLVSPKLNAANRAGDPKVAFLLLTTKQVKRAEYLTEILLDYNRDREIAQDDLISQAEEQMAENETDPEEDGIIILVGKYWNEGVLGLVASNLSDRYRVPTVVLSQGDHVSRASCRSIKGFDITACLETHADLLLHYGGHPMAAGFSIQNDRILELRERLLKYITQRASPAARTRINAADAEIHAREIDLRFYHHIRSLAPYGPGNPAPLFLVRGCAFEAVTLVGTRQQHVKGKMVQDGLTLPFIAFRMGKHVHIFQQEEEISLVCRTGFDEWQQSVQVEIVDLVG